MLRMSEMSESQPVARGRGQRDFCDGPGLTEQNCGCLPSETCTKLAVEAAECIAQRLDVYKKNRSRENGAALSKYARLGRAVGLER